MTHPTRNLRQCRSSWRRIAKIFLHFGSGVCGHARIAFSQPRSRIGGSGAAIEADELRRSRMVLGAAGHGDTPEIGSDARTSLELFHTHTHARLASHALPNAIFWEASNPKSA
jgi:hypothetical protein